MIAAYGLAALAVCVIVAIIAFKAGVSATVQKSSQQMIRETLRPLLLTNNDAVLYRQAAQILDRLNRTVDLEGEWGDNVVSPQTRERITDWLTQYKKETSK